jgi:polysaccharide export outer membrane protein
MPVQHVDQPDNQLQLTNQLEQLTRASYRLGPGDVVRINVHGHPDLSRDVPISADGALDYSPLHGVQVANLTVQQLEGELKQQLRKTFANEVLVQVDVVHYRTQHIYVLGAVRTPGVHPLQPKASLLDSISQAGGPTSEAGWVAVFLPGPAHKHLTYVSDRGAMEKPRMVRIDLEKLLIGLVHPNVEILSGDVIFIPERGHYFVLGGVPRPGQYRIERDMTVIRAISRAGGFSRFGSPSYLKVWRYHVHHETCGGELCLRGYARREVDEPPREFRVRLHDVLQPGDVLVVPEGIF